MGWQTLYISNPARLSVRHGNVLLRQDDEDDVVIPIANLSAVVIENQQVTVSAHLMALCAEHNVVVIFSDRMHLPVGVYYAFHQHSRLGKHANLQKNWTQPFKNRLWQIIIRQKIINQSQVLQAHRKKGSGILLLLSAKVQSGDKKNVEAHAAKLYWENLFDKFHRSNSADVRNGALNYGYSILRSLLAGHLSAHGFLPVFGIKHTSELNAFNLADDLIEVYRPIVDNWVMENEPELRASERLEKRHKTGLLGLPDKPVTLSGQQMTVQTGVELTCTSLLQATQAKEPNLLILPEL